MSYARFASDSSVYVFLSTGGKLECCGCSLHRGTYATFPTTDGMIEHLKAHEAVGDAVPADCYERLRIDQAENDAWMAEQA